jgi:tRNA(Ile)-lysidine synthase
VTLTVESLLQRLAALAAAARPPQRYVVAFSGGLDSTVLLHALAAGAQEHGIALLAVHINHGLQPAADAWVQHCRAVAQALGVACRDQRVHVDTAAGHGPEAAARVARYDALRPIVQADDWLLSAHHQDDQAETVLLNLLRGGGPAGVAGISEIRPFGAGWLARPLLAFSRSELQAYADLHHLAWLEDPSNSDQNLDRNFLRHEILPRLEARWPEAARRLQRSSRMASDAALLLDDLAAIDAASVADGQECHDRLRIDALHSLPSARQRNLLRYVIRQQGMSTPTAAQLQQVLDSLLTARPDAGPLVRWSDVEVRRFRNQLYVLRADVTGKPPEPVDVTGRDHLQLERGLGELRLEVGAAEGLSDALVKRGLELRYRHGGEKFRPKGQSHTRELKKLLQEAGIVPWMRDRIPLLYSGGKLVAVADLWLAADAASNPGVAIHWENRPSIH